jgi:hypothetical protein
MFSEFSREIFYEIYFKGKKLSWIEFTYVVFIFIYRE